jgi:hypothetical protein
MLYVSSIREFVHPTTVPVTHSTRNPGCATEERDVTRNALWLLLEHSTDGRAMVEQSSSKSQRFSDNRGRSKQLQFILWRRARWVFSTMRSYCLWALTYHLDQERWNIADWLCSLNFKPSQSEYFQKREEGTGEWLLESEEFKTWRDGMAETLWCPGIRGFASTCG